MKTIQRMQEFTKRKQKGKLPGKRKSWVLAEKLKEKQMGPNHVCLKIILIALIPKCFSQIYDIFMAESNWFRKAIHLQVLVILTRLYFRLSRPPPPLILGCCHNLQAVAKTQHGLAIFPEKTSRSFFVSFFAVIE